MAIVQSPVKGGDPALRHTSDALSVTPFCELLFPHDQPHPGGFYTRVVGGGATVALAQMSGLEVDSYTQDSFWIEFVRQSSDLSCACPAPFGSHQRGQPACLSATTF